MKSVIKQLIGSSVGTMGMRAAVAAATLGVMPTAALADEDISRQELVCDGHWETTPRQELLTPGHYETRIERVPVAPVPCP